MITYLMEQIPCEANQFSDSQEIPCIFWNPKVLDSIHRCLPPFSPFFILGVSQVGQKQGLGHCNMQLKI